MRIVKRLHVDLSVVFRLFPPKEGGIGSMGKVNVDMASLAKPQMSIGDILLPPGKTYFKFIVTMDKLNLYTRV